MCSTPSCETISLFAHLALCINLKLVNFRFHCYQIARCARKAAMFVLRKAKSTKTLIPIYVTACLDNLTNNFWVSIKMH